MAEETRTDELKAQNHAACLNGASTITSVIATHDKGSDATSDECQGQWVTL